MRQTQNTKKDNRKSIFVIALLLLLVAVIGFGGYTMSKYISSQSKEGSASVAKWGYTVTADTENIFGKNYVKGEITTDTVTEEDKATLSASAATKIVAPGHKGSMSFTVSGTAEVKAKISISFVTSDEKPLKDVELKYKKAGNEEVLTYNPITWTLTKEGETNPLAKGTLAQVSEQLKSINATYNAGTTAINDVYTLSWAWAFEGNDELDTILGMYDAAANKAELGGDSYTVVESGTNTSIDFTLNISIEQVLN